MTTGSDREIARAAIREAATQAWGEPDFGGLKVLDHYADAIVDALAAACRLLPAEPVNDIDATGSCCCAGCIGMGPCDRAESVADDRGRCDNCAGTGTDSTLVTTDPYPVYMPHPCGYCEPVTP